MKKSSKITSWIISDGTKGMENQSIALAKLLKTDFRLINYQPSFLLDKFPFLGKFIYPSTIKNNLKKTIFLSPIQDYEFEIKKGIKNSKINMFITDHCSVYDRYFFL